MFSLESFHKAYETRTNEVVVRGRKFQILLPKDLTGFINAQDVFHQFPLWAKIWPASWVLADHLAQMPVTSSKKFLEIGAGTGLVSIVADRFGHDIMLTEFNSDALQFARANARINQCPGLNIRELDWNHPRLAGRFDYIVGSEVAYKKESINPLVTLFKKYLAADGQVLLAGEMRKLSKDYFKALETVFDIRALKKNLRSDNEELAIFILHLTLKDEQ